MMLVSYATADDYLLDLPNLLRGWRGPVYAEILPADMSWTETCSYKPTLLRNAMMMHGDVLVYLDADAVIKTPFTREDVLRALAGKTFGVHWHKTLHETWCCSGTIFLDSRRRDCVEFLRQWCDACAKWENRWYADQAHLTELAPKWDHAQLGEEWCWMEPSPVHKGTPSERQPPDPVYIWHMQRSRQMAGKKGGRGDRERK